MVLTRRLSFMLDRRTAMKISATARSSTAEGHPALIRLRLRDAIAQRCGPCAKADEP